jgi:uncharacterized membrane protein
MAKFGHLWAVGFDDVLRAAQVRDDLVKLGWDQKDLILEDVAVVVRNPDGSFSLDRQPFPPAANILGSTALGFLLGLVVAAPLTGSAVGALLGAGITISAAVGIDDRFVRDVERLMKPGTSALFVLDDEGDMNVILSAIRGWGGTVLKTNVDLERARLIQSTLADRSTDSIEPDKR